MSQQEIAAVILAAATRATTRYGEVKTALGHAQTRAWWSFFLSELSEVAAAPAPDAPAPASAPCDGVSERTPPALDPPAPGRHPPAGRQVDLARPHPDWRQRRKTPGDRRRPHGGAAMVLVDPMALAEALGFPDDWTIEHIEWNFSALRWRFGLRGASLPASHPALEAETGTIVRDGAGNWEFYRTGEPAPSSDP